MILKPDEKYIEVISDDGEFQAHIDANNFVNISVETLSMPFFNYGIVINLGGVKYKINFMQDAWKYGFSFRDVKINWKKLVCHLKMQLHLIFNEKHWDLDYFAGHKGCIIDTVRKSTGLEDTSNKVVRLYIDNLISFCFYKRPNIFEVGSGLPAVKVKKDKKKGE